MKAIKVSFELNPTEKTLEYFLSTAIEQGISYWAEGRNCERTEDGDYISIDVRDQEDCESEWKTLDLSVISKGFEVYFSQWRHHPNYQSIFDFVKSNAEHGDYDAWDADLIVQLGLFGKEVYA